MNPVELVRVETSDGLRLDGALEAPRAAPALPVDAFLLVHGTGSNFYAPGVLERFARQAVENGAAALRVNTRGHDGMSSISSRGGAVKGGATFEKISDCHHDLSAWLDLLVQRGYRRIALIGHSMGGVKSIYFAAHDLRPEIRAVIGISPPRFCHARLAAHATGDVFRADFARAQELIAAGRPDELLSVTQPMPFVATAAGYVEKYGPEDRYDYLKFLPRVGRPVLILMGSETIARSSAFGGAPEAISQQRGALPHVEVQVIEGADIHYRNAAAAPFERAAAWLRRCCPL